MSQPGTRSRVALAVIWLAAGLVMILVPLWVAMSRWEVLLNGHPAAIAGTAGCAMLGLVAVVWAAATLISGARYDAMGDPEHPRFRTQAQRARRATVRIVLAVPALILSMLLVAWIGYSRPFAATAPAVAAMRGTTTLRVSDRPTWYELTPVRRTRAGAVVEPNVGLVFVPGARVDPRAYARVLRQVAAAGFLVIVIKEPFNFALPSSKRPADLMALHPEIRYWAVGGHSLGGVNAAQFAQDDLKVSGLLLYASYAASPVTRGSLRVTSISGDADGLATPGDIAANKAKLPPTSQFQVVKGGIHAYFGDYGDQPGDGTPRVTRAAAQSQIVRGSIALLASLTPRRTR